MKLKLGNYGQYVRKSWEVSKCGTGKGWIRSVGQIVRGIKKVLHIVKVDRNILHTIQIRKCNSFGHILSRNCLLKHVTEGKREKSEVTRR